MEGSCYVRFYGTGDARPVQPRGVVIKLSAYFSRRDEPVTEWTKAYDDLYPRYRELYPALKPTFDALGR